MDCSRGRVDSSCPGKRGEEVGGRDAAGGLIGRICALTAYEQLMSTGYAGLGRAGRLREAAVRLGNHASALIDQVYQREKVEEWRNGRRR
jgi:hypothetical protein